MYNKVFTYFIAATNKLYSNVVIHPPQYKFIVTQFKSPAQHHAFLSRGYCNNQSVEVNQGYEKMYDEQLNEYLKDPNYAAMYEKCKVEVEYFRTKSYRVPETLRAYDWIHLLQTNVKGQRRSYLEYRWKTEKKQENEIKKREVKKVEIAERRKNCEEKYKLSYNTLFHRIRDTTIMQFYNSRLINAMLHSSPIVFDLAYDDYMTPSEMTLCAKQLLLAFSENRLHDDPCNLYFCNANKDSLTMQRLHKTIPTMYDIDFPLNITSKSYLDIFDKSRLIYLTPHCNKLMTHYDHNAVYIIGAMIDKMNHEPLSLQKARKEGLKMAKFPLSEKLEWGIGSSKTLPLNHVLSILLDLRITNDWNIAFQHIPKRKLRDEREKCMLLKMRKRDKLISILMNKNK